MRTICISMAIRKKIDRDEYLFAVKSMKDVLHKIPRLPISQANAEEWGIKDLPGERIIFVSQEHQHRFDDLVQYDLRDYKIVNYDMPAISLAFKKVHRYQTIKDPNRQKVLKTLSDTLKMARRAEEKEKKNEEIDQESYGVAMRTPPELIKKIEMILDNPDQVDFLISNYEKEYFYSAVSFRYVDKAGQVKSRHVHLIKDQVKLRKKAELVAKYNIIFVDPERIKTKVKRTDDQITALLAEFDGSIDIGVNYIYYKFKS